MHIGGIFFEISFMQVVAIIFGISSIYHSTKALNKYHDRMGFRLFENIFVESGKFNEQEKKYYKRFLLFLTLAITSVLIDVLFRWLTHS